MNKNMTLKEIAERANTSINTVSRALNSKSGVSEQTRQRIMQVAAELNYRPNMLARSMRGSNTNMLGIVIGDISNIFFVKVLEGIEEITNKENLTLAIGNSSENLQKENKNVEMFLSYRCEGLLISPVAGSRQLLEKLKTEAVNFVVLDRPLPPGIECDHVGINNKGDSQRAVEHIVNCGHRDIAIINVTSHLQTEQDRFSGYKAALEENGIPLREEYVKCCDSKQTAAQACGDLLALKKRPTAIFVAKESLGLEVISTISNAGLSIPNDVSILLYGDPDWASVFSPKITCMQRPIKEIGSIGANILISRMQNPAANDQDVSYKNIVLDSKLMVRNSIRIL